MSEQFVETDEQLIARCRQGDERSFGVLYQRYRLPLYSYIHKLLPQERSLVDDIFQDVWCKALRSWDKYSDQQKFLAWLCRIAHNLVMDHYRRSRRMSSEELSSNDAISTYETGPERIEEAEMMAALKVAIESLPEEQREVLEHRRVGRSFKEIADLQGSSLNTVLGRMHYAVTKIRSRLREYME